ncbi:MAG: OmpA family protein [Myxococcales bacterium]|nr:OmpA family protein [Myxococcales bacterium]
MGIAAILLLAGTLFAGHWVEDKVLLAGHSALNTEEAAWVHLSVSGQDLIVDGVAPSTLALLSVTSKLQEARGPTILGTYIAPRRVLASAHVPLTDESCTASTNQLVCGPDEESENPSSPQTNPPADTTTAMTTDFNNQLEKSVQSPTSSISSLVSTATSTPSNPTNPSNTLEVAIEPDDVIKEPFYIRHANNVLQLGGLVANESASDDILTGTKRKLLELQSPGAMLSIQNQLRWPGGKHSPKVWLTGIEAMILCREGRMSASSEQQDNMEMVCVASQANLQKVTNLVGEKIFAGLLPPDQVHLLPAAEVDACEETLTGLLAQTTVEFGINSDVVRASSFRLLDRIAKQVQNCPGQLRIEGHTDNRGSAAFNLDLSRRRAHAVARALAKRGVAASRLHVVGFGKRRPLTSNRSVQNFRRNRRVEIHVVGS